MSVSKRLAVDEARFKGFLGKLLRAGVTLAALVNVAALVLLFVRGTHLQVHDSAFHGEPTNLRTLRGMIGGTLALKPKPSMQLGLMILVATPVARVAFSVIGFVLGRDRFYAAITLLVLGLLVASLFGITT